MKKVFFGIALAIGPVDACLATQASYQCADGTTVRAVYSAPGPNGSVQLTFGRGKTVTLPQVFSADGGRYADSGMEFWIKGKTARLTRAGAATECKTR